MPTLTQVEIALTACLYADPPQDHRLSADASSLTAVFAEMRFFKQSSRELAQFTAKQTAAFGRWKQPV